MADFAGVHSFHRDYREFLRSTTSLNYSEFVANIHFSDPEVHPQPETYWGRVNPIGPRACYDESKRLGETLTYAYADRLGLSVRIARIFNTHGPRMQLNDGRVVSNFIIQALQNKPLTVYGTGKQTRSFQYISDLVEGLVRLMASNYSQPVNLGNPQEFSVLFIGVKNDLVAITFAGSSSPIVHQAIPVDDPQRRRPLIQVAKEQLQWEPVVGLEEGLQNTLAYFRDYADCNKECLKPSGRYC
ncbi:unnamed protein product [Echinostoma caproni]|uniref:NAD-dependent epimerase/dehydratase domain-containing protein n=1 Tax=Echinostoma caproni TaxID=27848 RepID=A0A3P8IPN8_9TREM|nr:unnamed protein product [Echinostoma caproni]